MNLVDGGKFLNFTPLSLLSACLAANNCAAVLGVVGSGSGPGFPVIAMVPFTSMYASA